MKTYLIPFLITLPIVSFSAAGASSSTDDANQKPSAALYQEIAIADQQFFDAFNRQDVEKIKTLFSADLEFYHDKGGVFNYEQNMAATQKLFANNKTLRRELLKETLAVYPIKDYGAIETGEHRFCHDENGKQDCGTFKFLHVWKREGTKWKLAIVVSYAH